QFIHARDGHSLAAAGLWTTWHDREHDEAVTSHTVIACAPNQVMAPIHDRMPVILAGEAPDAWLDPDVTDSQAAAALLVTCPADWLDAYPVAPLVNNVHNDGPDLIG